MEHREASPPKGGHSYQLECSSTLPTARPQESKLKIDALLKIKQKRKMVSVGLYYYQFFLLHGETRH